MNPISASKKLLSMAGELRQHPHELPYALRWLHSMLPGHSPLRDEVPWITFRAIDWLAAYLRPNMTVFEYGAGGSTLYFARRVRSVVSVEHDEGFYDVVRGLVSKKGIGNCEVMHRAPTPCADSDGAFSSSQWKYRGLCFETYVKAIDGYPDHSFDLVLVDGRARVACVKRAIEKIKPGGAIMLDNSDRPAYAGAGKSLAWLARCDFTGITPCDLESSQTTVWRLPS
jgi:hypothetical protein